MRVNALTSMKSLILTAIPRAGLAHDRDTTSPRPQPDFVLEYEASNKNRFSHIVCVLCDDEGSWVDDLFIVDGFSP